MRPQPNRDGHHPGEHPLTEMLNLHRFVFCSGCLIGTVITSLATCLTEENLTARDYAIVSGIGCTGRSSGCFKAPAFHTTHGRAIPFATGLKLAKPRIKVFVVSGDGDISAIGGNHLIHAARRNIDISVICILQPRQSGGGLGRHLRGPLAGVRHPQASKKSAQGDEARRL